MFEHKLEEMRRQFSALQQFSQESHLHARALLPGMLNAMQRSIGDLQRLVAELPATAPPRANSDALRAESPVRTNPREGSDRSPSSTEIGEYQERLRALSTDLMLAEERERRRLALDLHDGLSQTIALTQMKVAALRASLRGRSAKALDEIEQLIERTNRSARSISFELSPLVLHELGLEQALHGLVENIQQRYGIRVELEDDGRPKSAEEQTRVILFRAIRELLINAAKHSGARSVRVRLARNGDALEVAVEDDGVGMQPNVEHVRGFGLFGIQERVSYVGGSVRIESAPGRGTRVRICTPLASVAPSRSGAR